MSTEKTGTRKLETLLQRAREGDARAREQVYSAVYPDLRRLARHYLRQERVGHTLQPTDLVNEVFLKLANARQFNLKTRAQLIAVFAKQMCWVLVDYARRRKALKRGTTLMPLSLSREPARKPGFDVLHINEALEDLEAYDERLAHVVEMKVFGGMNEAEIACVLEMSVSTVKRDWTFAKAWLSKRLG